MWGANKDIVRLERESVIPVIKNKIVRTLAFLIENRSDRIEYLKLCQRVEYAIRAWYLLQFEELLELYAFFDPVHGASKLEQENLSPEEIDIFELNFLNYLFEVMDKCNFKITTDDEIDNALSAQYRLNLPIIVDETKLDRRLFTRYFAKNPRDNLPYFADKFIIFRRGFGIDHTTGYFFGAKINTIIARLWRCLMVVTGIKWLLSRKPRRRKVKNDMTKPVEISTDAEQDDLYVERISIQKQLNISNLFTKITIQEPTFERIIVVYRRAATKKESVRNIYLKHFKNIPMADMEIVLPEKKNPGLKPVDWVKFLVSAAIGLSTLISQLSIPQADLRISLSILAVVAAYCVKVYLSFQKNLVAYQSLITKSVYNKQLDSGRGTILHLCDEVIQQEVKEVILAFFILMQKGKASRKDLDVRCEQFLKEEFAQSCNFDIDDAIQKLEKLQIVSQDSSGMYTCVDVKEANNIIGITTEEVVLKAKQEGERLLDSGMERQTSLNPESEGSESLIPPERTEEIFQNAKKYIPTIKERSYQEFIRTHMPTKEISSHHFFKTSTPTIKEQTYQDFMNFCHQFPHLR